MDHRVTDPSRPDDPLERARRLMADRLDEPPSLGECAATAGLSPFHFSRQFAARYGLAPIAYARALRLRAAAERLCDASPPRLIELAFDSGFDTQEGFTRAFAKAFGVTPGRYRNGARHPLEDLAITGSIANAPDRLTQSTAPERRPPVRVAGLAQVFDESNKAGIPGLWARLFQTPGLAGWSGGRTFGVCSATAADGCDIRYLAGVELGPDEASPPGLDLVEIPARDYLVFVLTVDGGDLHAQMQAAAREIWGRRLPAAGARLAQAPDLEVYPPGFTPGAAQAVLEWWIPVEPD